MNNIKTITPSTRNEPDYAFLTVTIALEVKAQLEAIVAYQGGSKNAYIARRFGRAIADGILEDFKKVPKEYHNLTHGRKRITAIGSGDESPGGVPTSQPTKRGKQR